MDSLVTNIAGACPSAFSGTSGAIFAQAVAALVTAHCTIVDDAEWPRDRADEVFQRAKEGQPYDFIIVGAGTAGSLLASRLSTMSPSWKLLLIEAGDNPGLDSEIPAFLFHNHNTGVDWNYKTQPDKNSCQGFNDNSCIWVKGRAMGGSSSINAMLYVRGHPKDYDRWKEDGNTKWGYADLLPYFNKIENEFNISEYKTDTTNPFYGILKQSWNELGFPDNLKEYEALIGTHATKLLISKGKRLNTAKISLVSASHISNLHIIKNTIVQRVIIDPENMSAKGVEIRHTSGVVMQIEVRKEVILSAGSVATPQIILLSGIGPVDHLRNIGINNLADLPVGRNLQDHTMLPLLLQIGSAHSVELSTELITSYLLQYMLMKTGPLSSIGITDFMCFINTKNDTDYPDVQFHHTFFPKNDQFTLKQYFKRAGYKNDVIIAIEKLNKENSLLGIYPTLLHPQSRGEILIENSDSVPRPVIKANYFKDHEDMATMIRAIRTVQKLLKTSKFRELGIRLPHLGIKACNPIPFDTDAFWQCYIENIATTVYHPVGTAKMGPISDNDSVVNSQLLVHGIKNLRVVDASVMPSLPGGNTMAPTLMIAEKAADIIKRRYRENNEL